MKPLAIGIDIGGTGIKFGLVDSDGTLQETAEIPTPVDTEPAEFAAQVAAAVRALPGSERATLAGVGCAGLVDAVHGLVRTSPNLPRWHDVPLADLMSRALGLPTVLLNDANGFGLAEARVGAGRGASPVVALTIGTGVGGALVVDGRLFTGAHGFAGEIGHVTIDRHGLLCSCGNRGCLEQYVGRRAVIAAYREIASPTGSESLTPQQIAAAAARGEAAAARAFATVGQALGVGLTTLTNLLDPALFVIGGGIAQAGELLLSPAREVLRAEAMVPAGDLPAILPAALGVQAGLVGAALHALGGA